jgi:hypothetical protein
MHDGNQEAKSHFCAQGKASFRLIKLPENKKRLKGTESVNCISHMFHLYCKDHFQVSSEVHKSLSIFNNNLKNVNHYFTLQ